MAECKEWLSMKPKVRWERTQNRDPNKCKNQSCSSLSSIPAVLIRKGCLKLEKQKGWNPFNILLCKKNQHAEIRADYPELKKVFDKYLEKISPNISELNLCVSSNFMFQTQMRG